MLPGTNLGSFGHGVNTNNLNNLLTHFNTTTAGTSPLPARRWSMPTLYPWPDAAARGGGARHPDGSAGRGRNRQFHRRRSTPLLADSRSAIREGEPDPQRRYLQRGQQSQLRPAQRIEHLHASRCVVGHSRLTERDNLCRKKQPVRAGIGRLFTRNSPRRSVRTSNRLLEGRRR